MNFSVHWRQAMQTVCRIRQHPQELTAVMQIQQTVTRQQTLRTARHPMQTRRTQQRQIPITYIKMELTQERPMDTVEPFRWK